MCGESSIFRTTFRRSTARQRESRTACVSPYILAVPSLRAARSLLTIPVSGPGRPPDHRGSSCSRVTGSLRVGDASCAAGVSIPRNASQIHGTATRVPHGTRFTLHPRCSVASLRAVRSLLTIPVSGPGRPPDHRGSSCSRVTGFLRVGDASCAVRVLFPVQRSADPRHGNESPARRAFHLTSSLFRRRRSR